MNHPIGWYMLVIPAWVIGGFIALVVIATLIDWVLDESNSLQELTGRQRARLSLGLSLLFWAYIITALQLS